MKGLLSGFHLALWTRHVRQPKILQPTVGGSRNSRRGCVSWGACELPAKPEWPLPRWPFKAMSRMAVGQKSGNPQMACPSKWIHRPTPAVPWWLILTQVLKWVGGAPKTPKWDPIGVHPWPFFLLWLVTETTGGSAPGDSLPCGSGHPQPLPAASASPPPATEAPHSSRGNEGRQCLIY